ncbi:MAG TPA: 50S ribosomal protein L28 [Ignavibacteriaceae bacterium]|jgi:large subunit ribosomal protein L28
MSRKCDMTGVKPISGSSVSHAHNRSKRRFLPNLQKKRVWIQELNRFVTLKLSTSAIKTISKNGTAEIAKRIMEGKIKV